MGKLSYPFFLIYKKTMEKGTSLFLSQKLYSFFLDDEQPLKNSMLSFSHVQSTMEKLYAFFVTCTINDGQNSSLIKNAKGVTQLASITVKLNISFSYIFKRNAESVTHYDLIPWRSYIHNKLHCSFKSIKGYLMVSSCSCKTMTRRLNVDREDLQTLVTKPCWFFHYHLHHFLCPASSSSSSSPSSSCIPSSSTSCSKPSSSSSSQEGK